MSWDISRRDDGVREAYAGQGCVNGAEELIWATSLGPDERYGEVIVAGPESIGQHFGISGSREGYGAPSWANSRTQQ